MAKLIDNMFNWIEHNQLLFWSVFAITLLFAFDVLTNGAEKRQIRAKYKEAHGLCEMFAGSRTVEDYRQCYEKWGKPVK